MFKGTHALYRLLCSVAVLGLSFSAFARTPPKLSGPTPPFVRGVARENIDPAIVDGPPLSIPFGPFTSGIKFPPAQMHHLSSAMHSHASAPSSVVRLRPVTLNVPTSATNLYNVQPAAGTGSTDIEPTLVTTHINGNSTSDYTLLAYSAYRGPGYHVQVASTSSLTSNSSTFGSIFEPYLGTSYTDSGDPYLATNPYSSGIRPGATYLSYVAFNRDMNGKGINPSQVTVWASDDGGSTWPSASTVASAPSGSVYLLDKPVMDVSWYSGTLGYLYVVWVEDYGTAQNHVVLRRNTNGIYDRCRPTGGGCVTSWETPIHMNVNPDNSVVNEDQGFPQVVVNPDNGNVYVFYLNFYGQLKMRRLVNGASTFDWPVTVVSGINFIYGEHNDYILPNRLRAAVVPAVRYNSVTHRIVATWHSRTAAEPTDDTKIYLVTFDPETITAPVTTNPQPLIDAAGTQMQPAVDHDNSGNMLLTYFSTEGSPDGKSYQLYRACLWSDGSLGCVPAAAGSLMPNAFIGDYHENYFWTFSDAFGGRWNTSWTSYSSVTQYDPSVTGIQ